MEVPLNGPRWYTVKTKPKNEKRAEQYLLNHGITTFLPWMETSQFISGKATSILQPLFPGYLFANFDLLKNYPTVKWGRGVNTILGFGKYPTPLADEVISIIKNRVNEKNIVKQALNFNKNDRVRIRSGPFKDLLGIFDHWVSESGRVKILLNLIGYQAKVELHYAQVELVH